MVRAVGWSDVVSDLVGNVAQIIGLRAPVVGYVENSMKDSPPPAPPPAPPYPGTTPQEPPYPGTPWPANPAPAPTADPRSLLMPDQRAASTYMGINPDTAPVEQINKALV